MACAKSDATKALDLFWNVPIASLWALFHASMHLQGLKVRYVNHEAKSSYRDIFKMVADSDTHKIKQSEAREDFREIDYIR